MRCPETLRDFRVLLNHIAAFTGIVLQVIQQGEVAFGCFSRPTGVGRLQAAVAAQIMCSQAGAGVLNEFPAVIANRSGRAGAPVEVFMGAAACFASQIRNQIDAVLGGAYAARNCGKGCHQVQ